MTQSQLFAISVRILGVYLLVEAVMQLPTGLVDGALVLLYGSRLREIPYASTIYPTICTAVLSFVLFVAVGIYLVMGAPHLFRLIRVNPASDKSVD